MGIKTGIRILFYPSALALLIHHFWPEICTAAGGLGARFNILAHRHIVRAFSPRSPEGYNRNISRYWNGEPWDDTTWIADSLVFAKFGFTAKVCEEDKNLDFLAQEAGRYCTSSPGHPYPPGIIPPGFSLNGHQFGQLNGSHCCAHQGAFGGPR